MTDQHWFRLSNKHKRFIKPIKSIDSSLTDNDDDQQNSSQKSFSESFQELLDEDETV